MSELFNLSIDAYNMNELKEILDLHDPFTIQEIVDKENILREKLFMDDKLTSNKKKEIINFLSKVKDKLIKEAKKNNFIYEKPDELINTAHSLQKRPGTSVSSLINPVPRDEGASEGVAKHTIHRLLCLDSRFRDNYYTSLSTDYRITLPSNIKNVISMELAALEFPNTYYQISKSLGNNYMWIGTNVIGNGSSSNPIQWFYISIPDGNYRRKEIESAINEQIKIATGVNGDEERPACIIDEHTTKTVFSLIGLDDFEGEVDARQLYIAFNRSSGKYNGGATVAMQSNSSLTDFDYDAKNNGIVGNLGWILGFRLGEYSGSWSYVSEGCYDAWGTKYLYIVINDYNQNVNNFVITAYNESIGKANVLARISTESSASNDFSAGLSLTNNTIANDSSIKKRDYFGPVNISKLEIQILDEFGRVIDLNNMDFSLALNLVCLYD